MRRADRNEKKEEKKKCQVVEDCLEFCTRLAHSMATVTDYESREDMKKEMEWVYMKTKFRSRLDS